MVRILLMAILVLLPVVAAAQTPNFALDVRPLFGKQVLNLHDDQMSSTFQKTRIEFSALAEWNRMVQIKYVIKPGFSYMERLELTQTLIVGNTDFGPKKDEKEAKPVDLEWNFGSAQRLELTGPFANQYPIRPVFIGEWSRLDITAISSQKKSSDTISTDTERFSKFVCGFGGTYRYVSPNIVVDVTAVGSKELQRFEASMLYRVSHNAAFTAGYVSETKDLGGVKWREHGPFFSVLWAF